MSDRIIRAAFETAVTAWAAAQMPAIPVAFENVDFTPPADGSRYVRVYLLPVPTETDTLDMLHRSYQGVVQITACLPKGQGNGPVDALHQSLAAVIKPEAQIVRDGLVIYITQPLGRASGEVEDDCFSVAMSTNYRAEFYPS